MSTVQNFQKKYLPAIASEDFFILLAYATHKDKLFLLAHPEYILTSEEKILLEDCLARRQKHEPVAYIVGQKEFYKRDFAVTQATLIPRPETEHLIEQALKHIDSVKQNETPLDIVDIGTGSGNIIITLASELDASLFNIHFFGIDISPEAIAVAEHNARTHHVFKTIHLIESDLLTRFPLPQKKNSGLIVIANLPYLSHSIYETSPKDVREYEPRQALVSGADGMNHYRRLLQQLAEKKEYYHSLFVLFEISPEQSTLLPQEILHLFPESILQIIPDLSGKNRLIQASLL